MSENKEKDFEIPKTVNIKEITTSLEDIKNELKEMKKAQTPQQTPTALTESMKADEKKTRKEAYDNIIKALKNTNKEISITGWRPPKDSGVGLFESIGGLTAAGSAVPEVWSKDVFFCCPYPASAFLNAPFIKWHDDLQGAGDTLHIPTIAAPVAGTAGCAEPVGTAPVVSGVDITLEEWQCALYICRNDLEDLIPDTLEEINNTLAACLDNVIDNAFIANIVGKGSTLDKGTAHITPGFIAEAIGTMRSGTCEPVVLIIHPAVEARLMQDSQFVNAATFGDRSVITGGHIIKYLGLDIVVVPKGSLAVAAPGTYRSLMLSRYAVHGAMKRAPNIETQYMVQTQRKYIYGSVRFGKQVVCNTGVLWMYTGA